MKKERALEYLSPSWKRKKVTKTSTALLRNVKETYINQDNVE